MKVRCQRFALDNVPRSSHSVSVVNNQLYVFGGEVQPRTPVEAAVYASELGQSGQAKHSTIAKADESSPTARVGHAAAVIGQNFYVFGGRGGKDMAPLKEEGRVWQFSTESQVWTALDPTDKSVFPEARSYHSATSDRSRYLYTHGGCPASGRTSDVYRFDVTTRKWEQLPSAPDPPRGGPGFTYGLGKLWRLGGFDGKNELGGQLDYLDVSSANQAWKSVTFDSNACPGPRSVTGLQVVTTNGTNHLVAFLGERDASKIGHEGAAECREA